MSSGSAAELFLDGDLIGFTAGLAITVLLVALTLRARKLPGTPYANLALAACGLCWNLGGLTHTVMFAAGWSKEDQIALLPLALQYCAAGFWPLPMLTIWAPYTSSRGQRIASRLLRVTSAISAAAMLGLWVVAILSAPVSDLVGLKSLSSYNGSALLALGTAVVLRSGKASRSVGISAVVLLCAVLATSIAVALHGRLGLGPTADRVLMVFGKQIMLVAVLAAFFLFARFRFADLFIQNSIRILLAIGCGVALAAALPAISRLPQTAMFAATAVLLGSALLVFVVADRAVSGVVNRWIFQAPNYRLALRRLSDKVASIHHDQGVLRALEEAARETLDLGSARVLPRDSLPALTFEPEEGEIIEGGESGGEVLVPVSSAGRITHLLAAEPGYARSGLLQRELEFLRGVAAQCGNRLHTLELEREAVARRSQEALLMQQVAEARLRALRAQVNPHFLFNSLNTIADLIATDASRAETMTLRLARVFRHVLTNSSRPLISLEEEIAFLRTYLDIEEARFGDRLRIAIDIAPDVAREPVPSLILQPIVENALRHGIGPKLGIGSLWITARPEGDRLCLKVEDDGVGLERGSGGESGTGVGLRNVAARLNTLYNDRAGVRLETREAGGACVTILLPRGGEAA